MTNYNDWDDDGENNGNEDRNDDNNATSGSGYNGLVFDPIGSCGGELGYDDNGDVNGSAAHYVSMRRTIYVTL